MKLQRISSRLVVGAAALLGLAGAAQSATVLFSSFEGNGVGGGLGAYDEAGASYWSYWDGRTLNDNGVIWNVSGTGDPRSGVDQIENAYSPVPFPDGDFGLDMNSYDQGKITTTLATVMGQAYVMSFYLSGNGVTGTVSALPGGGIYAGSSTAWVQHVVNFVATSTSTTISFEGLTPDGPGGTTLDNVVVQSVVPLPTAACAGFAAMAGLAGIRRRRVA